MKRPVLVRFRRTGFTLVEILVATTLALLLMGAVAVMFGRVAESITDSRSMLEAADRLRLAETRLQMDLAGITAAAAHTRPTPGTCDTTSHVSASASHPAAPRKGMATMVLPSGSAMVSSRATARHAGPLAAAMSKSGSSYTCPSRSQKTMWMGDWRWPMCGSLYKWHQRPADRPPRAPVYPIAAGKEREAATDEHR